MWIAWITHESVIDIVYVVYFFAHMNTDELQDIFTANTLKWSALSFIYVLAVKQFPFIVPAPPPPPPLPRQIKTHCSTHAKPNAPSRMSTHTQCWGKVNAQLNLLIRSTEKKEKKNQNQSAHTSISICLACNPRASTHTTPTSYPYPPPPAAALSGNDPRQEIQRNKI